MVTNYVDALEGALVYLKKKLERGDMISIEGPDTDLRQQVKRMTTRGSNNVPVGRAGLDDLVFLDVEEPVYGDDDVYLLRSLRKKLSGGL